MENAIKAQAQLDYLKASNDIKNISIFTRDGESVSLNGKDVKYLNIVFINSYTLSIQTVTAEYYFCLKAYTQYGKSFTFQTEDGDTISVYFTQPKPTPTSDDIADELQDIEYTAETENVSKTGKRLHVVASQLDSIEFASYDRDEAMDYALRYQYHWVYLYIPKVNRFTPCVMYRDGKFINHPADLRRVDLDDPLGLVAQHT